MVLVLLYQTIISSVAFPKSHPTSLIKTKTTGKSILSHLKYNLRVTKRIYVRHLIAYSSLEKPGLTLYVLIPPAFAWVCFYLGCLFISLNFYTLANIEISLMKSPNLLHRLTSHESHYQSHEMKLYLSCGS